jgi:tRNA A58 N-methylase Trm61
MSSDNRYVLGHTEYELERLARQARLVDPITRRFFVAAGIADGMRVLDVGSGAGHTAMLLADIVGPGGEVVGADLSELAIEAARRRAAAAGSPISVSIMVIRQPWHSANLMRSPVAMYSCSSLTRSSRWGD